MCQALNNTEEKNKIEIYWNNIEKCFHIKGTEKRERTKLWWKIVDFVLKVFYFGIMGINIIYDIFHKEGENLF